jgi:hypothetical protein
MRFSRSLPAFLFFAVLACLTGARPWHNQPESRRPAAPIEDPTATQVLDQALARLDQGHLPAIGAHFWQHVHFQDLNYQATGEFLQGPDQRFRLELQTTVAGKSGTFLTVCDGQTQSQAWRFGSAAWTEICQAPVSAIANGHLQVGCSQLGHSGAVCGPAFHGVQPLLANLRQRLVWTRREQSTLQNSPCLCLTGTWKPDLAELFAPAREPWPAGLAAECRLWLDAVTLWPRRIEWLGLPDVKGDAPVLIEMELRSPVFYPAFSAARHSTAFAFPAVGKREASTPAPLSARR